MMPVPARFNAASFFIDRHVAEGRADKVAFFHDGGSITYGALQELVNRAGNALLDLGVRPEQRVLCLLLDSPEFLATFWGAIKIGAIPIPVNTMMRSDDYRYFLDDSRAPIAVVSEPLLAEAGPALSGARFAAGLRAGAGTLATAPAGFTAIASISTSSSGTTRRDTTRRVLGG